MPELRLLGCIEVDRVFALPLQKDTDLIAVPLNAKIKLQRAKNMDQLENFIEYNRFLDKAQRLLQDARDRLQVIDLKLTEKETSSKKEIANNIKYGNTNKITDKAFKSNQKPSPYLPGLNTSGYILRKSASCDSTSTNKYSSYSSNGSIADEYDEIDQIYDYVRGFAPLPKNLNKFEPIPEPISHNHHSHNTHNSHNTSKSKESASSHHLDSNGNYTNLLKSNNNNIENRPHHHHHIHHPMHDEKPIPPPIETIPSKKQPEKRQRPTLPKLYVKNNIIGNNVNIHHHQKISSPHILHKDSLEPQSPLFHIR